jgi:nitrate reductase NapE component
VGIAIRPGYMLKLTSKKMENFLSTVYMIFGVLAVSLVVCGGVYGIIDLIL